MDGFASIVQYIAGAGVILGAVAALFKFFRPQLRRFFGVTAIPADVLAKVDELMVEVVAIKHAVLPPSDEQVQEALLTLQRAGAFDVEDEAVEEQGVQ